MQYENNEEEIASKMKNKYSMFKSEAYSNELNFSAINTSNINENTYEYKLKQLALLFPSIPIEKIERFLNENKTITLDEAIEKIQVIINSEKKINMNKISINNSSFTFQKRIKRNYNTLLSQAQKKFSNNKNTNKLSENSKLNFFENKNKIKVNEEERKKLELKTVDKLTEDLLNSKNVDDLKNYLFNQLFLLEAKKEKERKIKNIFDKLEEDRTNLNHCLHINVRSINKLKGELSKKENKLKELNEDINKTNERIKYYGNLGTNLYLLLNMNKLNIEEIPS